MYVYEWPFMSFLADWLLKLFDRLLLTFQFQLAHDGDYEGMLAILENFTDSFHRMLVVNSLDNANLSALHYVARQGNVKMVELLVEKYGARPNIKGYNDQTPLHYCVRYCRNES